jgi:leucyl aminopeptidase
MKISHLDKLQITNKVLIIPVEEGEPIPSFVHNDFPEKVFSGKKYTRYVFVTEELTYLLIGLGKNPNYATLVNAFRGVFHFHEDLCNDNVTLWFPDSTEKETIQAAFQGLYLGTYRMGRFKTTDSKNSVTHSEVFYLGPKKNVKFAIKGIAIAKAQMTAMVWVDLPPNMLTPQRWAKDVEELFDNKKYYSIEIFDEVKSKNLGLEAFISVGRGSNKPPRFIVVDYTPPFHMAHVGLVGKGITFDTGGLNIKRNGAHEM